MAFMRAYVSDNTQLFLVSDALDEVVMCGPNHITLPAGTYDEDDTMPIARAHTVLRLLDEYKITRFEIVEKYWGNLSAPGYLDQTDYVLGDTRAEVAQQLLNMYFDGDVDQMDADEESDVLWLTDITEGETV